MAEVLEAELVLPTHLNFKRIQMYEKFPKGQARGRHWKHLKQIIQAENYQNYPPDEPNYVNIESPPPMHPCKRICDITGFEVELSDHVLVPNSDSSSNIQASVSVDSFLDELLRNGQTCTHTHTCNPPGPDAAHTHTCYHTHTQVIPSDKVDDPSDSKNSTPKSRRHSGNREAVRKYREKKKAHTAYLEEEVKKLRLVNQQLIRKLQRQAILEAEILRLRCLLHDLRGKIDNEMGAYPLQKQCSSSTTLKEREFGMQYSGATMGLQCENEFTCFHPQGSSSIQGGGVGGCDKNGASWERNCQSAIVDCQANGNAAGAAEPSGLDSLETMVSSASQAE